MPLKTPRDEMPELNLTSMIDVLFLLIIFFMTGTTFSDWHRDLAVRLPEVSDPTAPPAPHAHFVIAVDSQGAIRCNGQTLTLEELQNQLTRLRAETPAARVSIHGDAQAPLQAVASVLEICRRSGVDQTGIGVRTAQASAAQERLRR